MRVFFFGNEGCFFRNTMSSRTTIAQFYFQLSDDYNCHEYVPHVALSIWDDVESSTKESDIRPQLAACFLVAQKLLNVAISDPEELSAAFAVNSSSDILRCERHMLLNGVIDRIDVKPHLEFTKCLLDDSLEPQVRQNAVRFFNLTAFLRDKSKSVCAQAAVHAAAHYKREYKPHADVEIDACARELISYVTSDLGVGLSLLASA